jgi:multiple sugar transport system substrate-binding protein
MEKRKTFTLLAVLVLSLSMILSACGQQAATPVPPTATTGAVAEQPTSTPGAAAAVTPTAMAGETPGAGTGDFDPSAVKTIEVEEGATLRVSGWGNPSEQQVTRDMLDRFTQVYPDVKISYEPIPDKYEDKIKTQISGGSEPDVFYVSAVLADELIEANKLLKLNEHMDAAGITKDDYYENLISIFSRDADVYGLPKDFGSLAVFYNTDMVESEPEEDWDWDAYKAWAEANTEGTDPNTKVFGTMHPPDNARWLAFAFANGATIESLNSPEAVAALDFYYSLVKDGTAAQAADVGAGWPGEAFGKKRAAAVVEGGWMVPFLADPAGGFQDVKYSAAPLPQAPNGEQGNLIFTNAYGASAATEFPKAAAALIMFLSGPENQAVLMRTGFALPTVKGFEGDEYFDDHPVDAVLFDTLNYGTVHYFGPEHGKILDAINQAMERVFRGEQGSQAALDEAAQEIADLMK